MWGRGNAKPYMFTLSGGRVKDKIQMDTLVGEVGELMHNCSHSPSVSLIF